MKKIIILLILLLVIGCTKVNVSDISKIKKELDVDKKAVELNVSIEPEEELTYDTPTTVIKETISEIEVKDFGDVV